jgi:hypothetical protein
MYYVIALNFDGKLIKHIYDGYDIAVKRAEDLAFLMEKDVFVYKIENGKYVKVFEMLR